MLIASKHAIPQPDAKPQRAANGADLCALLTCTYDLAGNRTTLGGSYAQSNLPLAVPNTALNANNQLTQFGTASLTYDLNGNVTSDRTNTYTWDARNHLVSISGAVSGSFQYDAFGRRVTKTVGGATTSYLYDGVNPVQELSGGSPAANLLTGFGLDEYLQRTDVNGPANFLTDALGSTLALTNAVGGTVASYTYDPYGNTTMTGNSTNPYQYTGRENDGTGLYYYRARYYSPTARRFLSEDPLALNSGEKSYAYVGNNPVNLNDPLGLCDAKSPYQRCIDSVLSTSYPVIGNWLASSGVPNWSYISLVSNTWGFLKTSAVSVALHYGPIAAPWLYGQLLKTTAENLGAYPGMAAEAAGLAETGAVWTGTAATAGEVLAVGLTAVSGFSTGADIYARWRCMYVF